MAAEEPPPPALQELLEAAVAARERAYAPYSRFRVGAAVRAGGKVFSGCNIENASYGATMCAERVAVFHAVAAGHSNVEAVAVVIEGEAPAFPCGECLQVLHEFNPDMWVAVSASGCEPQVRRLRDLYPHPFGPEDLT